MAAERIIPVDPETSIGELFEQVSTEPVVVSIGGRRFRIVREKADIWANYDPERVLAAFDGMVGMLANDDIDFEAWKQEVREQRGQYSSGRPYDAE